LDYSENPVAHLVTGSGWLQLLALGIMRSRSASILLSVFLAQFCVLGFIGTMDLSARRWDPQRQITMRSSEPGIAQWLANRCVPCAGSLSLGR